MDKRINKKEHPFFPKSRKGWIRIVEAFVAILLMTGVVIIVLNKGEFQRENISSTVHNVELSILREIQLSDLLREEILGTNGTVEWESFPAQVPKIKSKIESRAPGYLECVAKICDITDPCSLAGDEEKNIYAESVIITSNLEIFNPRLLKLFCWEK